MDIETYAAQYPQLASEVIELHLREWLSSRAPKEAPEASLTMLDIGCGSGRLIRALLSQGLLDGTEIHGIDLSRTNIERLRASIPRLHLAVDNAERLDTVADESIDLVISTQVLEHVDDEKMLRAVGRVLTPSGMAYISTVFKRPWARFIWRTESGKWALDPTHLREYTDDSQLARALSAADLEIVESRKEPVSFPFVDFLIRRARLGPERADKLLASPAGRFARRARMRIPGYFTWSLVLRKAHRTTGG